MGKYIIHAGTERPAFITGQYLEKGSGQTLTKQGSPKIALAVRRQDIAIPNRSELWGCRLDKSGNMPENPLNVKDTNYSGKVKWLKWGDPKGTLIVARFLKGYNTLDLQYQNLVLNADANIRETDESSSDAFFLMLQSGLNEFDEATDPLKIEYFKVHHYNQNSTSRNPEHINFMFKEKDDVAEQTFEAKTIDQKWDAVAIVKNAAKDNSLQSLKNLCKALGKVIDEVPSDETIYNVLLQVADEKADVFLGQINEHKKWISNLFVKADSFKLFDLTKDGTIVAGDTKKEILATEVPAKGEGMKQWLLENCFEEKASQAIYTLKNITDKIK
jgi:hypothetical protein